MIGTGQRSSRHRCLRWCLVGIWITFGASSCQPDRAVQPVDVTEADVTIEVAPDGAIEVHERLAARVRAGASTFTRRITSDQVDRIDVTAVAVGGTAIQLDAARAQGVLTDGVKEARVEWPVPASPGTPTVFEVQYRAVGVVGVEASRGRVRWPVFAANRDFSVGRVRVTLAVRPPGQLLRGSGVSEADWTVAYVPGGITASKADVGRMSATIQADLSIDPRLITRPSWQVNADLRTEFSLAFVAGALFVLVIGVGVIWIVWLQHPRVRVQLEPDERPTLALSPEAATVLLARRSGASGAIVEELRSKGLIDQERWRVREGFRATALVGGLFALVCAGLAQLFLGRFGWWAQLIPLSMLVVAVWFLLATTVFSVRTPLGEREARLIRRTSKASPLR